MARLNEYILGYHKGRVNPADISKLANAFLKLGICSEITADGNFSLKRGDQSEFSRYARPKFRYILSAPLGLYGALLRLLRSYGVILALFFTTLVFVFSLGRVWDVRIDGNVRLTDYEIEKALSACGMDIGLGWRGIDKEKIESEILFENSDIAWISINRRGTVAYVQIIESENLTKDSDNEFPFSNVVADRDGVITEITVESGAAVVKVGDVVKAGDVLISGVVENERGVSFCRAKGCVFAESAVDISAEAEESYVQRVAKRQRLAKVRIILFNFSVNIFKNYRNHENSCDIIKENRKIALFDKYRLPIRIEKVYEVKYAETERLLSEDEMTEAAKRELDGKIYSMFKNADVVKLRTQGEFIGDVYRITSRVVYSSEIGKESAIKTS